MELKYFLIFVIFILFCIIFKNNKRCINGFSVGIQSCPDLNHMDRDYAQMVTCYKNPSCIWERSFVNHCSEEKLDNSCEHLNSIHGWDDLSLDQKTNLCIDIYSDNRNLNCVIENNLCKNSSLNLDTNYLTYLNYQLELFKEDRNVPVLLSNDDRYKITTQPGFSYNNLNDHSGIIKCYTTDELFIQNTPNIEYLESKMSELNASNLLDVIYYAKNNKEIYDWSNDGPNGDIELGDIRYDGSTKVLFDMYNLIKSAKNTVTITTLGNNFRNDYMMGITFITVIKNGIRDALINNPEIDNIDLRILVGGPPGYAVSSQLTATLNFLTSDRDINQKCNIILINHNANSEETFGHENLIWNHSKIIMVDGSSIRIGGQNMYDEVYLSRDYINNHGGPILDTNLLFFTSQSLHIINFCNQLCYQSINRIRDPPLISMASDRNRQLLTIQNINDFSDKEIRAGTKKNIDDSIFLNNRIPFNGMFIFKYNNEYSDLSSIDADEQSRVLAFSRIAKETIYISQQRLFAYVDATNFLRKQFKSLGVALNNDILVKCVLSRPDYDSDYSSNLELLDIKKKLINNGCNIKKLKKFKLKYVSYISNNRNIKSAQHTKMWCVDEKLLSVGSHNFYGSPLQQSSIVLDDKNLIKKYLDNDFHSKWNYSINPFEIKHVVYIIRHGEKDSLTGPINKRGKQRRDNLKNIFNQTLTHENLNNFDFNDYDSNSNPFENKYFTPDELYAHKYPSVDSERCLQLIQDIADHLQLTIHHDYGYASPPLLGNVLTSKLILDTITHKINSGETRDGCTCSLVVWEHNNINSLANDLNVDHEFLMNWPDSDFDSVYELYYSRPERSGLVDFRVSNQNLP